MINISKICSMITLLGLQPLLYMYPKPLAASIIAAVAEDASTAPYSHASIIIR